MVIVVATWMSTQSDSHCDMVLTKGYLHGYREATGPIREDNFIANINVVVLVVLIGLRLGLYGVCVNLFIMDEWAKSKRHKINSLEGRDVCRI